jgi:hypothetical protein
MNTEQPPNHEDSDSSAEPTPKRPLSAMSNSKLDIDPNEIKFKNEEVESRNDQL